MKKYKTIDLLHKVYNGEYLTKKLRNIKTGEIIRQGSSHGECIDQSKHFFIVDGVNFCMGKFLTPLDFEKWLNQEWEIVQEPVDFMKAVNSGKRIVPESLRDEKDYHTYTYWLGYMVSSMAHKGNPVDLINGKWFIEEE